MKYKNTIIILIILLTINIISGQTATEIREVQELYDQYKKGQIPELSESLDGDKTDKTLGDAPKEYDLLIQKQSIDSLRKQSKYFGYDYFSQRDSIPFWPNLSSPENYILGPGDNVEISLWGRAQVNESYTINRDGNIYDKSIGIIYLNGKSLKEARIFLKNKFSQKISSLKGKNATSFINVTLGELKSINVHFIGNVKLPGVHLVHPMSTIITGLLQAGGVDTTGSLRKIIVNRNGEFYKEIDLYNYILNGESSENILLQNDDIVNVPTRISSISIEGEVYRNGIYEAQQSESLANIVQFAGGFKPDASNQMVLKRILPISKRSVYTEPIEYKTITNDQLDKIINQDGDALTIYRIPEITNEVYISGQVKNPGAYVLTDSMNLKDLLIIAGGIEDKNYLKSTYLGQIEIVRVDENSNNNIIIELNYDDLLLTNNFEKYTLQIDDHIIIHRNINYRKDHNIFINGEITVPGLYSLNKKDENLNDIVQRAGGFTDTAFIDGINITRNEKRLVWDRLSVNLMAGDSVFIPEVPGIVEIKGEVFNPGFVEYNKGHSVMRYINSAGGLTNFGNRFRVSVMYPNGSVKPARLLPRSVKEGSIIFAHKKPEREPINLERFLSTTVSLISSVALTYVALQSIK